LERRACISVFVQSARDPVSRKWIVEVSLDDAGYLTVRINPDTTMREYRHWVWHSFHFCKGLPAKELLAVVERALVDPAGQYVVFAGSLEPLWLKCFKEMTGG
jgi:hypothetical protein